MRPVEVVNGFKEAQIVAVRRCKCINSSVHNVKVIKYDDGSVWVACPMFGWYKEVKIGGSTLKLGCKDRKKRCTWFIG